MLTTGIAEEGLVALGQYLKSRHYRFTTTTPTTHSHYLTRHPLARTLRDILGWNLPFSPEILSEQEFALLNHAGIVSDSILGEGHLQSTVRYSTVDDLLLLHSAYPTEHDDAVFLGPDTYRFVRFLNDHLSDISSCNRVLDVGTGSGAAALTLAKRFPDADITATDINDRALAFSRVNARLADVQNLHILSSNLYTAVEGVFDVIVANPPYLLDGTERAYRHGGGNFGEGLAYKIVEGALSRLAAGGTLLLYTGVAIVDGLDPFYHSVKELLSQHGYSCCYEEIDPDVFGEELIQPQYGAVERIAVVGLVVKK